MFLRSGKQKSATEVAAGSQRKRIKKDVQPQQLKLIDLGFDCLEHICRKLNLAELINLGAANSKCLTTTQIKRLEIYGRPLVPSTTPVANIHFKGIEYLGLHSEMVNRILLEVPVTFDGLRALKIYYNDANDWRFHDFFERNPSITTLELRPIVEVTVDYLKQIIRICPNLKNLDILALKISCESMIHFVKKVWQPCSELKYFMLRQESNDTIGFTEHQKTFNADEDLKDKFNSQVDVNSPGSKYFMISRKSE